MQVIVAAESVTTSAIWRCCNPRGVDVLSVFERICTLEDHLARDDSANGRIAWPWRALCQAGSHRSRPDGTPALPRDGSQLVGIGGHRHTICHTSQDIA